MQSVRSHAVSPFKCTQTISQTAKLGQIKDGGTNGAAPLC